MNSFEITLHLPSGFRMAALLIGLISIATSASVALWVSRRKIGSQELENQLNRKLEELKVLASTYDTLLLEKRLVEYKKLWALLEKTSSQRILTLKEYDPALLSDALTSWYYQDGGMLMSEGARNAFFKSRASLDDMKSKGFDEGRLQNTWNAFSCLRTELCKDMQSRRDLKIKENDEHLDPKIKTDLSQ